MTLARLAEGHDVTERLIRYDMEAIGDWVRRRGGWLVQDPRKGLSVTVLVGSKQANARSVLALLTRSLEMITAVVGAAEAEGAPVILQFTEGSIKSNGWEMVSAVAVVREKIRLLSAPARLPA